MASVSILRRTSVATLSAALVAFCASVPGIIFGQAAGNISSSGSAPLKIHPKKHTSDAHKTNTTPQPSPIETRPPNPPPPAWPVNDKAEHASVSWNGRDLTIAAKNSNLSQILHDVSTATGLKIDGLSTPQGNRSDQRVYGSYGPAPARDVLSQLLEGSGYNVIMVGDRGEGTPRQLVLTAQAGDGKEAASQPHAVQPNQNGDEEAPDDPEPPEQPDQPFHRQFNGQPAQPGQPGPGGRTPQQMLQELQQQRQQQPQQQPQQGVPGQPQPPNN